MDYLSKLTGKDDSFTISFYFLVIDINRITCIQYFNGFTSLILINNKIHVFLFYFTLIIVYLSEKNEYVMIKNWKRIKENTDRTFKRLHSYEIEDWNKNPWDNRQLYIIHIFSICFQLHQKKCFIYFYLLHFSDSLFFYFRPTIVFILFFFNGLSMFLRSS